MADFAIKFGKKVIPAWLFARLQPWYHRFLAWLAVQWYRHSSRAMVVIGITGTNGKSTVVEFTHRIFANADITPASISSLRARIGDKEERNESGMTMPGRFALQRFLAHAKKAGCRVAIIEVTSEGIVQHRHCGIDFDMAVLTNLAPEHIERHGSFEAYRDAKAELFKSLAASFRKDADIKKTIVVNGDDEHADYFLQFPADQCVVYRGATSMYQGNNEKKNKFHITCSMLHATNIETSAHGSSFDLDDVRINLQIPGAFNIANALCAAAIARSLGISKEVIKKSIAEINRIPGRMDYIRKSPFALVVDYAHTPDALEKVYQTLKLHFDMSISRNIDISKYHGGREVREKAGTGRIEAKLICVLGAAGGGRDKWKRPELGRIASLYCDEIILTNEDPYDENPKEILHQIAQGLTPRFSRYSFVLNRREAIERAIRAAKDGDAVIITGKGAEPWMHGEGGKKTRWSDYETAEEVVEKIKTMR